MVSDVIRTKWPRGPSQLVLEFDKVDLVHLKFL